MKTRGVFVAVPIVLGFAFVSLAANVQPQSAPKDNKGLKSTVQQSVDLGSEIEGMNDRQLRMRTLRIEPGGHIGLHSHKDRPSVVYFLQGTDTVIGEDGTAKVFRSGDSSYANRNTTHWHRNDGKEPVVIIAVDIVHNAH